MTTYNETHRRQIRHLLVGHRVAKVADDALVVDNGTLLTLRGNDGGCCGSGDYDLTELNGVDNIIMAVEFDDAPGEDNGHYRIFVFADNKKINLATFTGSDGNGYYGTGYEITVASWNGPRPLIPRRTPQLSPESTRTAG